MKTSSDKPASAVLHPVAVLVGRTFATSARIYLLMKQVPFQYPQNPSVGKPLQA